MKIRLMTGLAVITLITAVSIVAFNIGSQANESVFSSSPDAIGDQLSSNQPGISDESIGVAGAWTIDVLESDGKLVSHSEFHNDLVSGGRITIGELLIGQRSAGNWRINLLSTSGGACSNTSGDPNPCSITQPNGPNSSFDNLVVEVVSGGSSNGRIRLSGTATAEHDAVISEVQTRLWTCDADITPINCEGGQGVGLFGTQGGITATDLASPITVLPNQQIQVTVEINFATAP